VYRLGENFVTGFEQVNAELVCLKQGVEFLAKIDSMTRITETYLLVLRARIRHKYIMCLEIDRLIVVKDRPDTVRAQYLFALIIGFVYMVQQHSWFRS
jgi:hypothetical protein